MSRVGPAADESLRRAPQPGATPERKHRKSPKWSRFTVAVAVGLLATLAAPSPVRAAAICGYYTSGTSAYWNNCSSSLKEYVHVDKIAWPDDYVCLTPGIHRLGSVTWVRDADMMYNCGVA
jgi:hypothetical protein